MIALAAFVDGCWDFSGESGNLNGLPIDYGSNSSIPPYFSIVKT